MKTQGTWDRDISGDVLESQLLHDNFEFILSRPQRGVFELLKNPVCWFIRWIRVAYHPLFLITSPQKIRWFGFELPFGGLKNGIQDIHP